MLEARCGQLADAVSAARIPFLAALTWSFVWAWALYGVEFGYVSHLRQDTRALHALAIASKDSKEAAGTLVKTACRRFGPQWRGQDVPEPARLQACVDAVKLWFEWSEKAYLDSNQVSFPGGLTKVSVPDLGIIGQLGLLLVLSWSFFAVRRENHAVRAIVDIDERSRKIGRWLPTSFMLVPQGKYLSPEHYAYAYHSVAQRFMFLFSQHSRPLLLFTAALCVVPALVASFHIYTDIRDLLARPDNLPLMIRTGVEIPIWVCIWLISYHAVRLEIDTSVLLNAWYLASRDVWEDQWDETTDEPAQPIEINVLSQSAKPIPAH